MDRIKSAYEMALERLKQRKEVPQSELDRMEYLPVGKSLGAAFLRDMDYDFKAELEKYPAEMREYILEGAQEAFLSNIFLPADSSAREATRRALEGVALLKKDKQALKEAFGQLEYLFNYYEQSLAQAHQQLKESFNARLGAAQRSMGKRMQVDAKPEKQAAFREEWAKMLARLNSQYEGILNEQKEKLRGQA